MRRGDWTVSEIDGGWRFVTDETGGFDVDGQFARLSGSRFVSNLLDVDPHPGPLPASGAREI